VCQEISDTWWQSRVEYINAAKKGPVNKQQEICQNFKKDKEVCNNKNSAERKAFVDNLINKNKIKGNQRESYNKAACVVEAAGSKGCTANPCNQYNAGDCTIQNTAGLCVWYTKDEVKKANNYFKKNKQPERKIPGQHGCYRNPCNGEGQLTNGKAEDVCPTRQNGVYQCTYCKGFSKMGCQIVNSAKTKAKCANVNDGIVKDNTIYNIKGQNKCQCSTESLFCDVNVQASNGNSGTSSESSSSAISILEGNSYINTNHNFVRTHGNK